MWIRFLNSALLICLNIIYFITYAVTGTEANFQNCYFKRVTTVEHYLNTISDIYLCLSFSLFFVANAFIKISSSYVSKNAELIFDK